MGELKPYDHCSARSGQPCPYEHRPTSDKNAVLVEEGFVEPRFRHVADFADMKKAHKDGFLVVDGDFDVVADIRTQAAGSLHIEYAYTSPARYMAGKNDGTLAQRIRDGEFGNTSMNINRFMVLVPTVRDVDLLEVYEAVGARADCTKCGKANLLRDGTWVQHTKTRAKTPCVHTLVPKKKRKAKA